MIIDERKNVPSPEEVWLAIATVVARAEGTRYPETTVKWANFLTDAFISRFHKKDDAQ